MKNQDKDAAQPPDCQAKKYAIFIQIISFFLSVPLRDISLPLSDVCDSEKHPP
jgi:hypothetical protein